MLLVVFFEKGDIQVFGNLKLKRIVEKARKEDKFKERDLHYTLTKNSVRFRSKEEAESYMETRLAEERKNA